MSEQNPWKTLGTKKIYTNPWISVREDDVIRPDGSPGIYGVIESKAATGVVALTPQNEIYLVGQYRYPTKNYSWEIVEGGAEAGEQPLHAIQRELQEEAGIKAATWVQLGGVVHLSNCFSAEAAYLYVARDLTAVNRKPDVTEILEVKCVPFSEALRMVDDGLVTDAMSIIAILRAQRLIEKGSIF